MILSAPTNPSQNPTGTFAFGSPTPNPDFYSCVLDPSGGVCPAVGSSYAVCPEQYSYSNLADGTHTICVYVTNTAGTPDPIPATYTWIIDTTAPETEIVDGDPAEAHVVDERRAPLHRPDGAPDEHVRVQPRRRGVGGLRRQDHHLHDARRGPARVRGAHDRPERGHRPDAGDLHLGDRPYGAVPDNRDQADRPRPERRGHLRLQRERGGRDLLLRARPDAGSARRQWRAAALGLCGVQCDGELRDLADGSAHAVGLCDGRGRQRRHLPRELHLAHRHALPGDRDHRGPDAAHRHRRGVDPGLHRPDRRGPHHLRVQPRRGDVHELRRHDRRRRRDHRLR